VEGFEPTATINEGDQERNDRVERENGRTEAIEGLDKKLDDNPYAPLGMRLGTFNVITTLEQGLTATDNANYSSTPKGAVLSETTLRLNAASDWSRHQAQINGYGTYRKSVSGEEVEDPSFGVDGTLERRHQSRSARRRQGWLQSASRDRIIAGRFAAKRLAPATP
jgi:hypothetical protein